MVAKPFVKLFSKEYIANSTALVENGVDIFGNSGSTVQKFVYIGLGVWDRSWERIGKARLAIETCVKCRYAFFCPGVPLVCTASF